MLRRILFGFAISVMFSTTLIFLHSCIGSDRIPLFDYVKVLLVSIGLYLFTNILFALGKLLGLGSKISTLRKLILVFVTLVMIILIVNSFTQSFLILVISFIAPFLIVAYIWSDKDLGVDVK